jgi:putative phage-type endonuclease
MKQIFIEQGSKEWIEFRHTHVGASDASCIMGVNPWKTKQMLWEDKVLGWEMEMTEKMREGTRLEPEAREAYIRLVRVVVVPMVLESSEHPFLSASMDGMTLDMDHAVEIKCGASSHRLAKKGEVPEYYVAQLHHQAFVTGLKSIDYFSYDGKNNILIPYLTDPNYIRIMVEKELEFWHCVQSRTPPKD